MAVVGRCEFPGVGGEPDDVVEVFITREELGHLKRMRSAKADGDLQPVKIIQGRTTLTNAVQKEDGIPAPPSSSSSAYGYPSSVHD